MSQPTVSVFIPSYNYRRYLGDAIDSILAQTWDDWELVIVDDASSDGSQELIAEYVARYPQKIRAFYLERNVGQSRCSRIGLGHCRGRYVSILASDDVATPRRLEEGVALMEQRPEVAAAFSMAQAIDQHGQPLDVDTVFNKPFTSLRRELLNGNFLCGTSIIARRELLTQHNSWNSELRAVEDFDLWVRLLARYELVRVDAIWVKYRIHDSNLSNAGTPENCRVNANYESLMVVLTAIEQWPLESIFDFVHAPGSSAHEHERSSARLVLARHCLELDQRFLGRPLLGLGKAYALTLAVSLETPDHPELTSMFRSIYAALGDTPRCEGNGSMRLKDWLAQGGTVAPVEPEGLSEDYDRWLAQRRLEGNAPAIAALSRQLSAVMRFTVDVLAEPGQTDAVERTLASLARQQGGFSCLIRVHGAAVTDAARSALAVETFAERQGWMDRVNQRLAAEPGHWGLLLEAGDQLEEHALLLIAERASTPAQPACCYFDQDLLENGVPVKPVFKPDFNLDLLRSYPYIGGALAYSASRLFELGGFDSRYQALAPVDFVFRVAESQGFDGICHIAEVLLHGERSLGQWLASDAVPVESSQVVAAHLQRLDVPHTIEPGCLAMVNRVRYGYEETPLVSVLIPTRDYLPALQRCVESLLETTGYRHYEVMILDLGSESEETRQWLEGIERLDSEQVRVLRCGATQDLAAALNGGVEQARGEYVLLLSRDTVIAEADWLDALLNHARRPEVGVVGAKLHGLDGTIRQAGLILGLDSGAASPFQGEEAGAAGYMHRLLVDQNYSAVSSACLMIRRSLYQELGGLEGGAWFSDTDLCLKARDAGYLTVWTPFAALYQDAGPQGGSPGLAAQLQDADAQARERRELQRKWLPALARDPAYNPNLGLHQGGFDIDLGRNAAWQPMSRPLLPRLLCYPADAAGCGHYRIRQPFNSLCQAGQVEGMLSRLLLDPVELERFEADVVVLQRQITDVQIDSIEQMKAASGVLRVYELDDYLPNVPLKSLHRDEMPRDILRSLRKAVSLTDRFIVSTQPLAEAFADLHSDIRVVPNCLPPDWWLGLHSNRRAGRKPRVGWAGGAGHSGDLELLYDVVRDLANEVEWVFFGMCPDRLRPYVQEFHPGVEIERYPAQLAALDLDLALAPLEQNQFNDCKSNLRLLEYGVLGFPVVCSDVLPYRGDLPVSRVKNRYRDWVDAIRLHIHDLDAAARAGDALQAAVRQNWMLDGENLKTWAKAWLPD
ncbi:glycosyltransferase [Pseudomonas nicosulfuronedens]